MLPDLGADRLTSELIQSRFVIEQIHMAWSTPHEQKDHSLRPRCKMGSVAVGCRCGKTETAKAAGRPSQQLPATFRPGKRVATAHLSESPNA